MRIMGVTQSWNRILEWHRSNLEPSDFDFFAPATSDELKILERAIGSKLPEAFRDSCQIHNGADWLIGFGQLSTTVQIADSWNMYRDWQSSGDYAIVGDQNWTPRNITGPIKPIFWNTKRVYVIRDISGDHIALDLDPPADGTWGQVIFHSHETGPEYVISNDWDIFLELYATDSENGKYDDY